MPTVSEVVKQLNTGCKVKSKHMSATKLYYLSMYRVWMIRLYDKGYISDPTRLDMTEIRKNIQDFGLSDMTDVSGKIRLTSDQTLFAYYKNKNKAGREDEAEFLFLLYQVLYFREGWLHIDKLYEDNNFRGSLTSRIKFNLKFVGAYVESRNNVPIIKATCDCLVPMEQTIGVLTADEFIWCEAMNILGVPKNMWTADGLIQEGFTHQEEVDCIYGILQGELNFRGGKYASLLEEWLSGHKWKSSMMSYEKRGLYETVCVEKHLELSKVMDILVEVVENDPDSRIVAVYGSNIFYSQQRTEYKMPIGMFQYVNNSTEDGLLLPESSMLYGLTAELFTEDRLIEDGTNYSGCPIILDSKIYYDIEQTDIQYPTFLEDSRSRIKFNPEYQDKTNKAQFRAGSLQEAIYNAYIGSIRSVDGLTAVVPFKDSQSFETARREVAKSLK